MKKILILLLVITLGVSSQGRIVSRPTVRSVSRVRVSTPKPRVSTFKASTPSRSSSATFKSTSPSKAKITSVKPISNTTSTTKKSSFFTTSQPSKPKIEPKSTVSSLNSSESKATNTVIYRDSDNNNFWNNLFFYNMLFNRSNKTTTPAAIPVKNEKNLTSDQELIKALEQKLNKVKIEKTGTIELMRSLEKTIELLKNNLSLSK